MSPSIVAIDQGTTSTRSIRFGIDGRVQAKASRDLSQSYPQDGWVEHDPEAIWRSVVDTLKAVVDDTVAAIGIANQRETVLLWDRATGAPLHNAIVWQDRRTASLCAQMVQDGAEPMVRGKTGLRLDPYFSATKLCWLLDTLPGARQRAGRGELAAGTIESFLLWRLTGGRVHASDVTNASRTMLYDIVAGDWDADLLALFDIPAAILPKVQPNDHLFGETDANLLGRAIPVAGMIGDQQAALVGQGCFAPGMVKATFGTGGFLLANIGERAVLSANRLLTTPAYRIGGRTTYAIEGSIFVAGAAIKWLRDRMGLIGDVAETAKLAASVARDHGVHLVPGFVGLGAPHWRTDIRASITGMTLETSAAHIARAALEAVAFQTCDLIQAVEADGVAAPSAIRIDGGMAANDWFAQFLADSTGIRIERPANHEATAMGAAFVAGLGVGLWPDPAALSRVFPPTAYFDPLIDEPTREVSLRGWRNAIRHALAGSPSPSMEPAI